MKTESKAGKMCVFIHLFSFPLLKCGKITNRKWDGWERHGELTMTLCVFESFASTGDDKHGQP